MRQFVEFETATLPSWTDASFDAAGDPCSSVAEEVRPWVACLDMLRSDGRHVITEAAVSTLFEEGCNRYYAIHRKGDDRSFRAVDQTMELGPCHAERGEWPLGGLCMLVFN